ncbi:TRAP transporter substrate-binding protein [Variovorax sp. J31P179]|uniref:TRAP transporter substrate-binding protein n=1 Tax=Variovorax sp. J31P179 TaxID=3053508 RepID=UPI0025762C48|nr:TRAP transporter substrate-binding protein [Variovorax sp. J31P179]MDM0079312.1 TRAP transporter substrate-binding protein [Variovorax sp. J31P179]
MKHTLRRRSFIHAFGAVPLIGSGLTLAAPAFAQGAKVTLKYANNLPLSHPMNIRAKEASYAIKQETQGAVDLQIFPSGQMGSDTDMLSQVRAGAIDFMTLGGDVLSTLVPVASICSVGFVFKNYDEVWAAMDGDLGAHIREAIGKAGLFAMEKSWDNGFRQITTSGKPVNTPADLKGMKIRVPVSPLWTSLFKAFDASPTSINFSEVYSALQTKVVEGQENPLALIDAIRLYEVQKFCSLTGHIWSNYWFLANARGWNKLPKDIQTVMAKHLNAAGVNERADLVALNTKLEGQLAAKGLVFNKVDTAAFRTALQKSGFYADWSKKYGKDAWAVLEKYAGALA